MEQNHPTRPLLLRETAELAFTEIKRYVEPRLRDDFNLRRVSAPLCLPAESALAGPGMHVTFPSYGTGAPMAIVTGLDLWLRSQLRRYDSAPGFGVFTVMNAIRPDIAESAVASPHVTSWAWQQTLSDDDAQAAPKVLAKAAKSLYALLRDAEKRILDIFPHLSATLPEELTIARETDITALYPSDDPLRSHYQYMRQNPGKAIFIIDDSPVDRRPDLPGQLIVWNEMLRTHLTLAEIAVFGPGREANLNSVGGNIWRDTVALLLLHQTELLK